MHDVISVIVPVYKVALYLDSCIRSIAGQSYNNLEIILVDDGSPDGCPAICDAWARKDSRIKVIHKENGGLSDARNAGLAVATGECIAFVDSDDTVEPDFLHALYGAMQATGADITACGVTYVDETGEALRQRQTASVPEMGRMEALRRLIPEDGVYQTVWNKLYRRDVIEGILFEKGKHHEDDFWTWQVFERITKLAMVRSPLYNYLQRGGSIIGAGYTVKRLDGLEARYLRMKHLQKYEELAALSRQQLTFDCMWHLQSVLRCLEGEEKEQAKAYVLYVLRDTPKVSQKSLTTSLKYRVWYTLFRTTPVLTANLRNALGVGA